MGRHKKKGYVPTKHDGSIRLTGREKEILDLICEDLSNDEIATKLKVSTYTVKAHIHNMFVKNGWHRRWEAAAVMIRKGK